MHVPGPRRPRAIRWLRGQSVALQNNYLIEAAGERPRGPSPPMPAPITMACLPIRVDVIVTSQLRAPPAAEVPTSIEHIATHRRKETTKSSETSEASHCPPSLFTF
ncbi:hypothetical protein CWO90_09735 [Bradyrhizobium sp. Leo121]|nr:hypothetical protein CWO90_09735 [Bradyrhizobium sp. Leo121]